MPKYTIRIADIDIAVNTAESPETVDALVSLIDRHIHDIVVKSPRCTKSEAAILCALDYCAEKTRNETRNRELEKELSRVTKALEELKAEHTALSGEAEELRRSNRVMRDIIAHATATAATLNPADIEETVAAPAAEEAEAENAEAAPVAEDAPAVALPAVEADSADDEEEDVSFESEATDMVVTRRNRRAGAKPGNKSKVGDMFDLLTFKDI